MCHNPNGDDSSRRPAASNPPESIDFKHMIHRIHTGADLTADVPDCTETPESPDARGCFTIYGFGTPPSVNNFNHVVFPGDRRDCERCHLPGTEELVGTPPAGWLKTNTLRDWYAPQFHNAAACLGCHDTQAAAAHAFLNTAPFGEACAVCHGADGEEAVDKVHAR